MRCSVRFSTLAIPFRTGTLADYLTRERDAATTINRLIQILDRDSLRDAITEVLVDARVYPRPRADVPEREL